jgi:apolipoprotein N-acyltransferase
MVILGSVFAGLFLHTAFAPFNFWFAAPLALAFLLYILSDRTLAMRLASVFLFGSAFYLPLLSWSNTYVGNIPWLLLALLQTLFFLPLAFIRWSKNNLQIYLLFPSLWVALEWGLAHFPFGGFGWGRVGFSQANSPYSQLAQLGGVPLLSFFVASLAVVVLFLFFGERNLQDLKKQGRIAGGVMAAVVLLSLSIPLPQSISKINVLGVQGGVPRLGLEFNERAKAVFQLHLDATKKYLSSSSKKVDLIVWPENSIDVDPFENIDISSEIESLVTSSEIPLIAGAVTRVGNEYFNESILWLPKSGVKSRYAKQHLTPFGEYIPLRTLAEKVSPHAQNVADFSAGGFNVLHKIGSATIAPLICYELLDDALGRSMGRDSNVILVQTNSATFGLSSESAQQLNITRIRAIEHQRHIVSIATSGISAFIDPRGRITDQTGQNVQALISRNVDLINAVSVSDKFGSVIEVACIFLAIPLTLIKRRKVRGD